MKAVLVTAVGLAALAAGAHAQERVAMDEAGPGVVGQVSTCRPVRMSRIRGDRRLVLGNVRLSPIRNGVVPCLHSETAEVAECKFTSGTGTLVETEDGPYAVVGQPLSIDGERGGEYVVAARMHEDETVPCVEPLSRDSVGTPAGVELATTCTRETLNSAANTNGRPMANFATREVCTSSSVHPDGATFTRMNGTSYCYTGTGAGLNDINGAERDETGVYLPGAASCHTIFNGYYETTAAKRPATAGGYPVSINIHTPVVWRPVATVPVAN